MNSQTRSNGSGQEARRGCCSTAPSALATAARDPVCGMQVDSARTQHRADCSGTTYFFCSARCHARFTAEPGRYVGAAAQPQSAEDQGCCATSATAPR